MGIDPEKWEKVNARFEQALREPSSRRQSFVDTTPDDEIRAEVQRLLLNHDNAKADRFLSDGLSPEPDDDETSFAPIFSSGDVLASRFRIQRYIAHGGMGEVYEAEDLDLHEQVALKTIRPMTGVSIPHSIQRFKREVVLSKKVTHRNVCRVFDFFRHVSGDPANVVDIAFVSMELLNGETLSRRLRRTTRLQQDDALPIIVEVAAALDAAHAAKVLHRDLKPGNIFIESGPARRVVVTDFGLAMALTGAEARGESRSSVHELLGTPGYMSPEQLAGEDLTPAADVYSLGLIMYRMLTGVRPFEDETPFMERVHRMSEPARSPRLIIPDLAESWAAVVLKCLERDPSRRFQTAGEIVRALRGDLLVRNTPRPRKMFHSVAVLPLGNKTGAPEMEYLSDGITETVINSLSRLTKIRVMAHSTVLRYKNQAPDPRTVGRELEVGYVLVGSVSQRGPTLNISVELVDVTSGWQLWGNQYERRFEGIFDVQEQIAREISDKLQLKLTGDEKKRLAKKPTLNAEAYRLYLKGRHLWNKRTEADVRRSVDLFQRAIQTDPRYAAAYAGLADAFTTQAFMHLAPDARNLMINAQMAASKAVSLDESLGEAHASLGIVALRHGWDMPGAERALLRAITLNPGYATAYQWYGECLAAMGRAPESIEQLKKALDLDPFSPIINAVQAAVLYFAGRYDESIAQCRVTLQEIEDNFWPALQFLGLSYEAQGKHTEAVRSLEQAVSVSGGSPLILGALAHAYAVSGSRTQAEEQLDALRHSFPQDASLQIALTAAALGDGDAAFAELNRAVERRSPWLIFLNADPRFGPLRSDPRFAVVAGRIGIA